MIRISYINPIPNWFSARRGGPLWPPVSSGRWAGTGACPYTINRNSFWIEVTYYLTFLITLIMLVVSPAWGFNNSPVQGMHQEIQSEMEEEEPLILPHVEILWRHTVKRSPTLQLAIQKLAEKSGQIKFEDKSEWTRKILQNLVQVGGMGGAVMTGSPAPLIGSAVIGRIAAPIEAPKSLTEVTSADLVILTREIEDTQSRLILNYLQYRQALEEKDLLRSDLDKLQGRFRALPQDSPYATGMLHALVSNQALKLKQAEDSADTYRNLLILLAGEEGIKEIDSLIIDKEAPEKGP